MNYLPSALFAVALADLPPPTQLARRSQSGDRAVRSPGLADTIDDVVNCRLVAPVAVLDPKSEFTIVRVGFRLNLDPEYVVSWMRLQFDLQDEDRAVTSLFPAVVASSSSSVGRFGLSEQGILSLQRGTETGDVTQAQGYFPFQVGNPLGQHSVFWDFLPRERQIRYGQDRLLFALLGRQAPVRLLGHIMIAVGKLGSDPEYFEVPPEALLANIA
jgi:hypothetical protein